jgi:hypothetical protein
MLTCAPVRPKERYSIQTLLPAIRVNTNVPLLHCIVMVQVSATGKGGTENFDISSK